MELKSVWDFLKRWWGFSLGFGLLFFAYGMYMLFGQDMFKNAQLLLDALTAVLPCIAAISLIAVAIQVLRGDK